jgi:hypothetical protein
MNRFRRLKRWDRGFETHYGHGCLSAFILFVLSCVGSGLATAWSPVQGVLPTVYTLRNWKSGQGPQGQGCTQTDRQTDDASWRFLPFMFTVVVMYKIASAPDHQINYYLGTWDYRSLSRQNADHCGRHHSLKNGLILWYTDPLLGKDSVNAFPRNPMRERIERLFLGNGSVNTTETIRDNKRRCFPGGRSEAI